MSNQMPVLKEPMRKRKGSKKLLFVLFLLFISLLAVLFFNSSISRIAEIQLSGAQFASSDEIVQAAGISVGDAFFQTRSSVIANRVQSLPQVEEAIVTKKFPGIVKISVKEYGVVVFELTRQGSMAALLSSGAAVEAVNDGSLLVDRPVLTGWEPNDPVKSELTKQLARIPVNQLADLSEITPYPSKSYPDRIRIYTRTKFEVITAVSVLPDKIEALNAVIETQEPGKITMLLADTYVPFESEHSEKNEGDQK